MPYLLCLIITNTMATTAIKTITDATAIPTISPTVSESESVSVVTENRICFICQSKHIYIFKDFVKCVIKTK